MNEATKPLPIDGFMKDILIYESKDMYITITKSQTNFEPGIHKHNGFEFIIPIIDMPSILVDKKTVFCPKNYILPINPKQEHGVSEIMKDVRFVDILFDENFMNEITYRVFGVKNIEFYNECYKLSSNMQTSIHKFIEEVKSNSPGKEYMLNNISCYIAVIILREIKSNSSHSDKVIVDADKHRVSRVIDYMKDNYKNICSLKELAEIGGISQCHLIRIFRNCTGKTPYDFLLDIKIEQAKILLSQRNMSILEVCFECGFNNVSHFNKLFKQRTATTPSLYRSMVRSQL